MFSLCLMLIDLDSTLSILSADGKKKASSYSFGRKLGVNKLSDKSSLPFHMIVFRAGWLAKNLHSAFDYIFNSMLKDEKCGKGLADWDEEDGLKHEGGYSPNFYAIATEKEKATLFVQLLFFKQKEHVDIEVSRLLFASLLRFYNDFEHILATEPNRKFEHNDHPLQSEINKTMQEVNVSDELFKTWQQEVKNDFVAKNYLALPQSDIQGDIRVDVRTPLLCLRKVEQSSSASYSANAQTQTEVRHLREEVKMLRNTVEKLVNTIENLVDINSLTVDRKRKRISNDNENVDVHEIVAVNTQDRNNQHKSVNLPTWETVSNILKKTQLEDFIFNYMDYQTDMVYDNVGDGKKSKIRTEKKRFTKLYETIMLCKCTDDDDLTERPSDPAELLAWKNHTQAMSRDYYDNAKRIYEVTGGKGNIGRTNLTKHYGKMKAYLEEERTVTAEDNEAMQIENNMDNESDALNVDLSEPVEEE